ncbi:hypothetical protein [Flavobacterium sp.]|uniref:hypothetical protein n=1 Tax=Flavobacterium sp. TaxID=239 RepID=UPI0011FF8BC9|nr:hypothetical protein [Flavobacterium sp.]RZJ70016.1 MAG: hypothetical protein EOO49_15290 [Flavobacterium sp.]
MAKDTADSPTAAPDAIPEAKTCYRFLRVQLETAAGAPEEKFQGSNFKFQIPNSKSQIPNPKSKFHPYSYLDENPNALSCSFTCLVFSLE